MVYDIEDVGMPDDDPGRRERWTNAALSQLVKQMKEILEEDNPQSVRHMFYRMTDYNLPVFVQKTEKGYNRVQHQLKLARRSGEIPYSWISDASRSGYRPRIYSDLDDYLDRLPTYRSDIWKDTPYHVEVWVESRSLAGVLWNDCWNLAVNLYPTAGFSSLSFANVAAEDINDMHLYKQLIVFYVGDYDPAGVLIDKSLEKELRIHLNPLIEKGMHFERLALLPKHIELYDLPTKPRKEKEKRAKHIETAVEAESLPAHVMREEVRRRIEALLPDQWRGIAAAEEESVRKYIAKMKRMQSKR